MTRVTRHHLEGAVRRGCGACLDESRTVLGPGVWLRTCGDNHVEHDETAVSGIDGNG